MFLLFFDSLRRHGVPDSLREFLDFPALMRSGLTAPDLPENWLRKMAEYHFTEPERAEVKAMGRHLLVVDDAAMSPAGSPWRAA